MTRTIWLASYPKSGNTWFRMLLANLDRDTPADINDQTLRHGIASARGGFDDTMLFPAGLLTHDECDRLRTLVYRSDAWRVHPAAVRFVKTHDAWTRTTTGEPLLGGRAAAEGAILIVRDPRAVAPSLANHNRQSLEAAIAFLAAPDSSFSGTDVAQPGQLRQRLCGWSGYNASWLDQTELPVHVVRYEDMRADIRGMFARALTFAGVEASDAAIDRAIAFADFAALQAQEQAYGFGEAPPPRRRRGESPRFFRRGLAEGWREELSDPQRERIEQDHHVVMARLGYHRERVA